jgi:hypothetical protein
MDTDIHSWVPLLACLVPLLAVVPIMLFRGESMLREGATLVAGVILLVLVISMIGDVSAG